MSPFRALLHTIDIMIPRFITEDCPAHVEYCGECSHPHPFPAGSMTLVRPGDRFDGILTVSYFNLFGFAFRMRWDEATMRPWVNPHDKDDRNGQASR